MAETPSAEIAPVVKVGRNCWRIARANRVSVVVDAADYFHFVRELCEGAQYLLLFIGWDFDSRISLEPGDRSRRARLSGFFLRLARRNPRRRIAILKWRFGALKQFLIPSSAWTLARWATTRAIEFKFDGAHPAGCSHHQKIVIVDDCLAVCGGIDLASGRWDTPVHLDDDPKRLLPNGQPHAPWHDITMLMGGDVAGALGELARDRWAIAGGKPLPTVREVEPQWPDDVPVLFENVDLAIARTRASYGEMQEVREIEALYLDMIAAAQRFIYIENQYLTSAKIAAAIAARMGEDAPPDIVVVMPRSAEGWLEQIAMDAARVQLARAIGKVDKGDRFRIYVPVTKGGADIYVHAKLMIVDDRILRIGSANLNNRSLGLDSECDMVLDCALPANKGAEKAVAALRTRLLAEHLDVDEALVAAQMEKCGSLVDTVEALRGEGKTLELLDLEKPGPLDKLIAENELLDPEHAEGFFEPLQQRGLRKRWREGRARIANRLG
ncbi:MAG: phospholipase [Sphingomonadales bacterium]|jgi:phosphatidylserine/phosphatidylglycerophosphate/cardiolipin synthase-like enzyme|nr:phospholipase [Sphingomonadales bacterium]MBK9003277.1 phospholipase [Sphingomonadales bacterium]MBK9268525.1 phospholipase [Sphingomonadales bacterium]MBP6433726.1 phospholipase [Sphingorhabdus sp.]